MLEMISVDQLVDASGGDMYARVAVANGTVGAAWASGGAVLWVSNHRGRPSLAGVGPAAAVAALVASVGDELLAVDRASLPRGWTDALPPPLVAADSWHWDWMWTTTPPQPSPGDGAVRWLDAADDDAVRALLHEVSPDASAWPGDGRSLRWAGLADAAGELVACLADTSRGPTVGNLASVAVSTRARRRGYGRALVAWTVREFLAEGRTAVTLGMHADNDAARAMYTDLGFQRGHAFTSAALTRAATRAGCPAH